MNKPTQNLFTIGKNNTIKMNNRSAFSYRGQWISLFPNTVLDTFHVGDFSSANYFITAEFGSNEKETLYMNVVARPEQASFAVFGRASINQELFTISVTADASICKVILSPSSLIYQGTKVIFTAQYAETINPLEPPAIVLADSTDTALGINTFDETTGTFDTTSVTFDVTT